MTNSFRDPTAKPGDYRGIQMRSGLELAVAQVLDDWGVQWAYEAPAPINGYLPDFTIVQAHPQYGLTRWVEVKPAQLLYDTRDRFGLREDLAGEPITLDATVDDLHARHIPELHKPQRLAAATGEDVLVVSALNRNRTLSITCHGDSLSFTKWHPGVNWKTVVREQEQEAERFRRQVEYANWQSRREHEEAERAATRAYAVRKLVNEFKPVMPGRFPSVCLNCLRSKDGEQVALYRPEDRWLAVCLSCVAELTPGGSL
jgi:hypothetical protein